MIFSSIPFLYYFLPVVIVLYFAVPKKLANSVLLLASLFFYGYGEPKMLLVMVATIIFSWAVGLKIPEKKWLTAVSVAVSLGVLVWFKYMDFFVESFADAFGVEGLAMNIEPVFQIGKSGLTPEVTEAVRETFNTRELVKLAVLKNCFDDPNAMAAMLADRTGSQVVQVIGKKIVLYKESKDHKKIELPPANKRG